MEGSSGRGSLCFIEEVDPPREEVKEEEEASENFDKLEFEGGGGSEEFINSVKEGSFEVDEAGGADSFEGRWADDEEAKEAKEEEEEVCSFEEGCIDSEDEGRWVDVEDCMAALRDFGIVRRGKGGLEEEECVVLL